MKNLFLTNYTEITFLNKLKESLNKCISFYFSVSFIKKAGLVLFERELEEALARGVKGKIVTSTYQNFTDILSLNKFLEWQNRYPNFECHLDYESFKDNGFHSKGYLFEYSDGCEFLVGSTNITRFALLKNVEWNVALYSNTEFESIINAKQEFSYIWDNTYNLDKEIIHKYQLQLDYAIEKWDMDYIDLFKQSIKPNSMQRKALKELRRYRDTGIKKMLVVAATGVGKTYLAAFDAKNFDAKRLVYIVHRDSILEAAKNTFMKVFGATRSYGMFTGKVQELDREFLFATNTMMANHLDLFSKDYFDYIVYDEAHHIVADKATKIIEYFTPEFALGLTATPERMDEKDVFSMFEQNVPFELRLRDAIINDLVVPFRYYGIKDVFADYSSQDKSKIAREISKSENVEFISSQIEKYRLKNEKLKAIAFCTSIAHANLMASELFSQGYNTISLTGSDNLGERIKAFNDLQNEENPLEIICTVDILNEGVDIPAINMVLFLRPTESQTIFLQQLGRGLRKYINKEYVTVLDFIGNNYDRSIQIALALGTLSKNTYTEKAFLKDMIQTNFKSINIPGVVIEFDELAKIDMLDFINKENFNKVNFLAKDYNNFKNYLKLDKYPSHMDYLDSEIAPNLLRFIKSNLSGTVNKSYYTFLKKIGEESIPLFTDNQVELIDNISDLLPIVRPDEFLIINQILNDTLDLSKLVSYNNKVTLDTLNHAKYILEKKNIISSNKLNVDNINEEYSIFLNDLIEYALTRYDNEFGEFEGSFKLYGNYYKEQIQMVRLKQGLMYMKGTEFDLDTNETILYVGLHKDVVKDERLKYRDRFINSKVFEWESEVNTTMTNTTGQKIINTKVGHLFIRKMKSENGITLPFTYFGTGRFENIRTAVKEEKGKTYNTLLCDFILDNEVPSEYHLEFNIPEEVKE